MAKKDLVGSDRAGLDVGAAEADGHCRLADNHPVVLGLIERIIDGLATLANGDDDAGAARRPDRRPQTTLRRHQNSAVQAVCS